MNLRCITVAVLALALSTGAARGGSVTIISNLPNSGGGSIDLNAINSSLYDSVAAGFTLPAGSDYSLDSVVLTLTFFGDGAGMPTGGVPRVDIYSNVSASGLNEPGQLLETLNNPPIFPSLSTDFEFTDSAPLILHAGMTYWVVVSNSGLNTENTNVLFDWSAGTGIPTGAATSAGYRSSVGPPPPTGILTFFNPDYSVTATAVPEPSPPLMVATAALAGLGVSARKRRSAAPTPCPAAVPASPLS